MRIIFFNHFRNGDIFLSRGFVRQIMQQVKSMLPETQFAYAHTNPHNLLIDLPEISYEPETLKNVNQNDNLIRIGDDVYLNSWYCQQGGKYYKSYGLTFDCLYKAFDDICKRLWDFSLADISDDPTTFFPSIDYSKCPIENVQSWLSEHKAPKILIGNGQALSTQAINFNMAPIIAELANRHKDKIFILSSGANIKMPENVFYTNDITGKKKEVSDLNEVSFLSNNCDTIIGRASGAFTFAQTKENFFERKVKFIGFVKPIVMPKRAGQFWLGPMFQDKIKYSTEFILSLETEPKKVLQVIEEKI